MACQGTAETSTESPTSIETKCQSSVNPPYIFIVVLTVIFIIFVFYLFSLIKVFLSLFLIFNVTMHPNELLSKILILIANQDRCFVTLLIDLFFFYSFFLVLIDPPIPPHFFVLIPPLFCQLCPLLFSPFTPLSLCFSPS